MKIKTLVFSAALASIWNHSQASQRIFQNLGSTANLILPSVEGYTPARSIDKPFTVNLSVAAEDFVLYQQRTIEKIVFFSVEVANPVIIGGDWYIYDGGNGTWPFNPIFVPPPGFLLAWGSDPYMVHESTQMFHPFHGEIYRNIITARDLSNLQPGQIPLPPTLNPGRYYIAFRSILDKSADTGSNGKNGALAGTTPFRYSRGYWNPTITETGGFTGNPWVHMNFYSGAANAEWMFYLEGY